MAKRVKQPKHGRGESEGRRLKPEASRKKELSINEFLGHTPDEAAELFVDMYRGLFIDESKETIARQSYAAAVVNVLGAIMKAVGIDRALKVVRTIESENQDQWKRLGEAFVDVCEAEHGNSWKDFRRRYR